MKLLLRQSDRWDLGEFLGWKELAVTLRHQEPGAWLVELDDPFEYEGTMYRYLVIEPRHEGTALKDISEQSEVACNMTLTPVERAESALPCDLSWWRGGHAMIGTVSSLPPDDVAP